MSRALVARVVNIFIRVFIVAFVFIMDVRVKADAIKIVRLQNIMNFDPSSVKSNRTDGSIDFFQGRGFFLTHQENSAVIFHTPQGVVTAETGQFTIEVNNGITFVNVISGAVAIKDRASQKEIQIKSGYSYWLGGLLSQGFHAHPIELQAYEVERVRNLMKWLSPWGDKEIDSRLSDARSEWRAAVDEVALRNQTAVNSDFAKIKAIVDAQERKDRARARERLRVQNLFRARTLGVPDENTEFPSELPRVPASDERPEDTAHN